MKERSIMKGDREPPYEKDYVPCTHCGGSGWIFWGKITDVNLPSWESCSACWWKRYRRHKEAMDRKEGTCSPHK